MKVLKFGGTSVGSVESLRAVKQIVEGQHEPAVVVVSAMGGVTNQLLDAAQLASMGQKANARKIARGIEDRHIEAIEALVPHDKQQKAIELLRGQIEQLQGALGDVGDMGELTPWLRNQIVAFGELMSSPMIAAIISGAKFFNSLVFIKTHANASGINEAHMPSCFSLTQRGFAQFGSGVAVAPGFVATDAMSGEITNLGRGGSDFTAAIIAAALDATSLEIWTDVDGFMTADPRTNPDATVIPHMSYDRAAQMCRAGAKVIYYPTIAPVEQKGIPVWVKNTFNPTATGTLIDGNPD